MKLVTAWIVLSCSLVTQLAAAPAAVFDFVRPVLQQETVSKPDTWQNNGNGGYVLRFDLDITGDGIPEMFLGSTLWFRNASGPWRVYRGLGNGRYIAFRHLFTKSKIDGVQLNATEISVERRGNDTAFVSTAHDRHGVDNFNWYIGRYIFSDTEVRFERQVVPEEAAKALEQSPTIMKMKPEVYGVLLAELLQNPSAEWKRIDFSDAAPDPDGYYIARSDLGRVKQLKGFTPEVALKLLENILAKEQPSWMTPSPFSSR